MPGSNNLVGVSTEIKGAVAASRPWVHTFGHMVSDAVHHRDDNEMTTAVTQTGRSASPQRNVPKSMIFKKFCGLGGGQFYLRHRLSLSEASSLRPIKSVFSSNHLQGILPLWSRKFFSHRKCCFWDGNDLAAVISLKQQTYFLFPVRMSGKGKKNKFAMTSASALLTLHSAIKSFGMSFQHWGLPASVSGLPSKPQARNLFCRQPSLCENYNPAGLAHLRWVPN